MKNFLEDLSALTRYYLVGYKNIKYIFIPLVIAFKNKTTPISLYVS